MSVWVCVPSARPPEVVREWAKAWRERGYKVAVLVNDMEDGMALAGAVDQWRCIDEFPSMSGNYPGYAIAVNTLISEIIDAPARYRIEGAGADAEWFVIGGDDVFPDPNHTAEELAGQLREHFAERLMNYCEGGLPWSGFARTLTGEQMETFGVIQPTGDRWGESPNHPDPKMRSAYIDRVAGSAWIGREFAKRVNGGKGPLWPEYLHMGVDEELQAVAEKFGVFWQRPDLTQLHQHWGRPKAGEALGDVKNMPDFLKAANSPEHWKRYKEIFEKRKAAGFPGSEPI